MATGMKSKSNGAEAAAGRGILPEGVFQVMPDEAPPVEGHGIEQASQLLEEELASPASNGGGDRPAIAQEGP